MRKLLRLYVRLFCLLLLPAITSCNVQKTGIWQKFEITVNSKADSSDPFRNLLTCRFTRPDGTFLDIKGFYAGNQMWKVRVMPDMKGNWSYTAVLSSDSSFSSSGRFNCVDSDLPGLISADEHNPVWFGFKGGRHLLIRSFHTGDRFFAENWPDTSRKAFLDWLNENRYNTISVASHLLNRDEPGRGRGWNTPDLWNSERQRPDPSEFDKLEKILDELEDREIIVFPFAGFFGQDSDWPKDPAGQQLFLEYANARLGSYWNLLYNVAGPEPLYVNQFTEGQVDTFGLQIQSINTQKHLLTVHNQKDHNPFCNKSWITFQCLQGPTTLNPDTLYKGLMIRRNPRQPLYAQEVLWYGNIYQQHYTDDQLRKNAFTIMMAGGALNFGDNAGTSSTGFTGTLDLADRHQDKHEIIKKVWDFFESIPYYRMSPSPESVNGGFCLSDKDSLFLVYTHEGNPLQLNFASGNYTGEWISGSDTNNRYAVSVDGRITLTPPSPGDWFLYIKRK